jgi:hypothetical protein
MQQIIVALSLMLAASVCPVYAAQTMDYLKTLANIMQSNLFPPHGYEYGPVAAQFELLCDGSVRNIRVTEHPVYYRTKRQARIADQAVVGAIKNASPRLKPPSDFHCPTVVQVRWKGLNPSMGCIPCEVSANGKTACDSKSSRARMTK